MTPTFPFSDVVTLTTQVRKATKIDLLVGKSLLRIGQPFYLYSKKKKRFEGLYVITKETSSKEMEAWYSHQMVYVPIQTLDNRIEVIPDDYFKENNDAA